ncbi:helix-turn-helix domain-containing protein [Branchiibius cervicis]|uniref:Helix-turn-helix domain-containing protein n=1 Tax=Branchiibius cervicis TaxID=908252 RepID=A0ABW2AV96_9MICO
MSGIGERVLDRMNTVCPEASHREIAAAVGLAPDAFSRSLNGQRRFSSLELARLADHLDTDLHWLITGAEDPNRLRVAARHNFDPNTGRRDVPGSGGDAAILGDIALAYRQAYPAETGELAPLPTTIEGIRSALGPAFVRPFADRLEQVLGIGVVRISGLSTAYSFTACGHRVIAMGATGNWFFENWSMAHELGHLVFGHHAEDEAGDPGREAAANAFAADLLMPKETLTGTDWATLTDAALAQLVWDLGVSTKSLAHRLDKVYGRAPDRVNEWASRPTQRLIRLHLPSDPGVGDELTERMDAASQRRFPVTLQLAHLDRIASGEIGKETLAWMLGVQPESLEVDTPQASAVPPTTSPTPWGSDSAGWFCCSRTTLSSSTSPSSTGSICWRGSRTERANGAPLSRQSVRNRQALRDWELFAKHPTFSVRRCALIPPSCRTCLRSATRSRSPGTHRASTSGRQRHWRS